MTTDDRYNGWANRETWAVALHINNDQGWQESVHEALRAEQEAANEYADSKPGQVERFDKWQAGDVIRESVEELFDYDTHDGIFPRDLFLAMQDIGSAWRIDWAELGAAFLADITETA